MLLMLLAASQTLSESEESQDLEYAREISGAQLSRTGRKPGNFRNPEVQLGSTRPNEFHLVHSMIVGDDGLLYVCDRENNRIQIFNADGEYQNMWTDLLRPMDISQDPDGVFCISEGGRDARQGFTEDTDSRISLMNQAGELLARWTIRGGHGSWIDAHGDIYVGVPDGVGVDKYVRKG